MIHEVTGDLLAFDANVLCHQTNCYGVMGAGIAASIRQKVLTAEQFNEYTDYCMRFGSRALGTVLYSAVIPSQKYIANCFSQRDWTTDNTLTDYDAFHVCLTT